MLLKQYLKEFKVQSKVSDNFLHSEKGAVSVIEASVIYPVVVLTVIALVYIGMYIFEVSYLNDRARSVASLASKTLVFTGYDELGDIYTHTGFRAGDVKPDRNHVSKAYSEGSPYRYLVNGSVDDRFTENTMKYVSDGLFVPSDAGCTVSVNRRMFDRRVDVSIEKDIRMPGILKSVGAGNDMKITVNASAVTSDPAEFVRNTDLTFRVAEILGSRTGITEKLAGLRSKFAGRKRTGPEI